MCSVSSLTPGAFCPTCPLSVPSFLSQTPSGATLPAACPHLPVVCSSDSWRVAPPRPPGLRRPHEAPMCTPLCPPQYCTLVLPTPLSRVLGWLPSISALFLNRVCVFHLLNSSTSQDPRVAFVFSLVMCTMSEWIPSQGILSTVVYRVPPVCLQVECFSPAILPHPLCIYTVCLCHVTMAWR